MASESESDKGVASESIEKRAKKGRGKSKDMHISLNGRVTEPESSITELKAEVDKTHKVPSDEFKATINVLGGDIIKLVMNEIAKVRHEVKTEVSAIRKCLNDLEVCVGLLKKAVGTRHMIDVPGPTPFLGKREARAVDDFIWEIERYHDAWQITDDTRKINIATMFLKETAALWWRRRDRDIQQGTCTINT